MNMRGNKTALLSAMLPLVGFCAVGDAYAADAQDMAAKFGARPGVSDASLSPDGQSIAVIIPTGARGVAVTVADIRPGADVKFKPVMQGDTAKGAPRYCRWASNARLLCDVQAATKIAEGDVTYVSRFFAVGADGSNMAQLKTPGGTGDALNYRLSGGSVLDWSPGKDGHVLMVRRYVPEVSIGTHAAQTKDGLGVDDIDSLSLKANPIETAKPNAVEYISDGYGQVRILGTRGNVDGYDRGKITYSYRQKGQRGWQQFTNSGGTTFDPYAVDPALDVAYGLMDKDGRQAAFSWALDGSNKASLVFAHPSVDVDGFARIGRHRRVVGVSYATDRREIVYTDPELKKLAAGLSKALPNLPLVRFVDASEDEKSLLIWAGSDVDPGRYYIYDKTTHHLDLLFAERGELEGVKLAPVKSITYPAADGTMVPAYLTLPVGSEGKKVPAIVLPHGGPSARDEWGFDWLSQYFVSQGFAVLQPNFRGSAGYGDAWFQDNGFKSWRTAIGDVNDAGKWLVSQGITDPSKLVVFGWSYGGYAALQSAVADPGLFKAVVAVAPVTDLNQYKEEWRIWSNFDIVSKFVGDGPHIEEGSPARHADKIKVPVLMFHGTLDRNVNVEESRTMQARLQRAGASSRLVQYEGLDHYLDDSDARADMLRQSSAFIKQAIGQ